MCRENCKGLIFSGYENIFYSNGRFESKKGVRLRKRSSCAQLMNEKNGILSLAIEYIGEDFDIPVKGAVRNARIRNHSCYKLEADGDGEFWFKEIRHLGKNI